MTTSCMTTRIKNAGNPTRVLRRDLATSMFVPLALVRPGNDRSDLLCSAASLVYPHENTLITNISQASLSAHNSFSSSQHRNYPYIRHTSNTSTPCRPIMDQSARCGAMTRLCLRVLRISMSQLSQRFQPPTIYHILLHLNHALSCRRTSRFDRRCDCCGVAFRAASGGVQGHW